jgi:hypothetical protein
MKKTKKGKKAAARIIEAKVDPAINLLERATSLRHEHEAIYVMEKELDQVYADYPRKADYINLCIALAALCISIAVLSVFAGYLSLIVPIVAICVAASVIGALLLFGYYDSIKRKKDAKADEVKKLIFDSLKKKR